MPTHEEARENRKEPADTELSADEETRQKDATGAGEAIEKNPDIEDPRLFSPLQEPDRPDTQERVSDEKSGPENTAG